MEMEGSAVMGVVDMFGHDYGGGVLWRLMQMIVLSLGSKVPKICYFLLQLEHLHWFKDVWRRLVLTKTGDPEKDEQLIPNQEQ